MMTVDLRGYDYSTLAQLAKDVHLPEYVGPSVVDKDLLTVYNRSKGMKKDKLRTALAKYLATNSHEYAKLPEYRRYYLGHKV